MTCKVGEERLNKDSPNGKKMHGLWKAQYEDQRPVERWKRIQSTESASQKAERIYVEIRVGY